MRARSKKDKQPKVGDSRTGDTFMSRGAMEESEEAWYPVTKAEGKGTKRHRLEPGHELMMPK